MDQKLYLYLTEKDWAEAWVNGGKIPIKVASTYKADYRDGIFTPDENIVRELKGLDENIFTSHIMSGDPNLGENSSTQIRIGKLVVVENTPNGRVEKIMGENIDYLAKYEEGYIQSFSNTLSEDVMEKFKKKACVQIVNPEELEKIISAQLNLKCIAQKCKYTDGKNRNHFLKSVNDEWQDEFRFFWKKDSAEEPKEIWVDIPANSGKIVI